MYAHTNMFRQIIRENQFHCRRGADASQHMRRVHEIICNFTRSVCRLIQSDRSNSRFPLDQYQWVAARWQCEASHCATNWRLWHATTTQHNDRLITDFSLQFQSILRRWWINTNFLVYLSSLFHQSFHRPVGTKVKSMSVDFRYRVCSTVESQWTYVPVRRRKQQNATNFLPFASLDILFNLISYHLFVWFDMFVLSGGMIWSCCVDLVTPGEHDDEQQHQHQGQLNNASE